MSFKRVLFRDATPPADGGSGTPPEPVRNFGYDESSDNPPADEPPAAPPVEPAEPPALAPPPVPIEPPIVTPPPIVPATPPVEPPATVEYDWRKEIKALPKSDIFRELGLSDFEIGLLEYQERTGDLTPYLEVKTVDYTKMSAEDLLKLEMRKQNPGMSEASLNFRFAKELNEKYYLDREAYPEGTEEANFGQEVLRLDAEKKRKEFIDNQSKFKAPEKAPDPTEQQREAEVQQQLAALGTAFHGSDATITLKANKSLQFGEGEESFNYPIANVDDLLSKAENVIMSSGRADLTGLDMKQFYKSLVIGANPDAFLDAYGKHQRALEHQRIQAELQNVTPPTNTVDPQPGIVKNYGYGG